MEISLDTSVALATIFILSVFVGFEVISKVSVILHTPLMSGANAIHGIILVGAIIVTANAKSTLELSFGLLAIVLATVNLVGGFAVTERMLQMFKPKPKKVQAILTLTMPSGVKDLHISLGMVQYY